MNPYTGISIGAPEHTVMYLSTGNQYRHSKLSSFPDDMKNQFYAIENQYQNNERYQEATDKALNCK